MKRSWAALLFLAASLDAQNRPSASPVPKPPAAATAGAPAAAARKTAGVPSYKDLKYPPLRQIQTPQVDSSTLPNGMKLYLLEDHELPVVSGTALVRTGNLFDPPDKIGLATVTGIVMRIGGTPEKAGDELDVLLENMAASVESSIGETSGTVSFSALSENTGDVLAIFKGVLTTPEFRQDKIDFAKSQISNGISRRNDNAAGLAQREFSDLLYGKTNSYGWREEYATIAAIGRRDLQAFYQRYFFPANVMLAVRGDFDTAEMKARLAQLFAGWTVTQEPVPAFPKVTPGASAGIYLAAKKEVAQTFFQMGQLAGELRDKDYPALSIMADILGGGFQSRLVQRIRTKMGNAYNIGADWGANYDHPGIFQISGSTKSLSTVDTIKAVQEEVERIRTTEVTDEELKTAKDTALNGLIFAFDTKAKTLNRLLTYEYYGYPKDFIQQYQKGLSAVSKADVLRVAKAHLDPAKFTIVAVGNPPDFGKPLSALGSAPAAIDLTIAVPLEGPAKQDESSMAKGKRLLQRMQEAAGGTDKLAAIKDVTQLMNFQLSETSGNALVTQTEKWVAPSHFRQESQLPQGRIVAYTDGGGGWISTPQGQGGLTGLQWDQVRGDLFRLYYRLLLSDQVKGRTINAIDDTTVEIREAGDIVRLNVNPDTGLPASLDYQAKQPQGPPLKVEDNFSGFREVDGIKFPVQFTILNGGRKFADVTVTEIRLNTGLKEQDLARRR